MCKEELIAAQSMLQNNSRLQERLEYVEKKIQSIRTCGNVMSKERLLQILNSADVDEILSLGTRRNVEGVRDSGFAEEEALLRRSKIWKRWGWVERLFVTSFATTMFSDNCLLTNNSSPVKCRQEENMISFLYVITTTHSNREFCVILVQHFPINVVY